MTTEPQHHEAEDFDKTITFESGQFAIVDAEVVKSLKDKIPLAEKAIFVATKQSRENASEFKISAEYDDATLRRLVIEPIASTEDVINNDQVEESIQISGKGGDPVEKKMADIGRIGGTSKGGRPNSQKRSERNKKGSAHGDQKAKLTNAGASVKQRIDQKTALDGARRDNYGQPRAQMECMDLLTKLKDGLLTEDHLNSMTHAKEIRQTLAEIRTKAMVSGKSFDLVYEAIQTLDEHFYKSACSWVRDINKGSFNV